MRLSQLKKRSWSRRPSLRHWILKAAPKSRCPRHPEAVKFQRRMLRVSTRRWKSSRASQRTRRGGHGSLVTVWSIWVSPKVKLRSWCAHIPKDELLKALRSSVWMSPLTKLRMEEGVCHSRQWVCGDLLSRKLGSRIRDQWPPRSSAIHQCFQPWGKGSRSNYACGWFRGLAGSQSECNDLIPLEQALVQHQQDGPSWLENCTR